MVAIYQCKFSDLGNLIVVMVEKCPGMQSLLKYSELTGHEIATYS